MRRPFLLAAALLALIGLTAVVQWPRVAARLDTARWQLVARSDAPFLTDVITPRIRDHALVDGHMPLEFFYQMVTEAPAGTAELRTRVFVPDDTWVDVIYSTVLGRQRAFVSAGLPASHRASSRGKTGS